MNDAKRPKRDHIMRDAKTLGDLRAFMRQVQRYSDDCPINVRWDTLIVSDWLRP